MKFLVNINEQADGTLPVDQWHEVEAEDAQSALVAVMQIHCTKDTIPERGFVGKGRFRHDNGTPMVVDSFKISKEA